MTLKSIFIYALAGAALLGGGIGVHAQVFFTMRGLLSQQFQQSEHVRYVRVSADGPIATQVSSPRAADTQRDDYVVFVATSGGEPQGYAVFDSERGQHEFIDFASFFDADGRVSRVEVVAYREAYGDGIRSSRFRQQFVGLDASSRFRAGHEIDIVSGATISSHSMSRAVRRAAMLVEHVRDSETPASPR